VYGERQLTEGAYATAIGIFLEQLKEGKPFTIFGDGEQRRDFTYVKDVVRANLSAVDVPHGIYNVGTGRNYSINEVVNIINKDHPKIYSAPQPGEYPATLADTTRFQKAFGWKPETKLEDWLTNLNS
jgi:UDP-glucose 4-epimerase